VSSFLSPLEYLQATLEDRSRLYGLDWGRQSPAAHAGEDLDGFIYFINLSGFPRLRTLVFD
jgi:hypothetical protein